LLYTVNAGIVATNNHCAGIGAATTNMFRFMRALAPVEWAVQYEIEYPLKLEFPEKMVSERPNESR